VRELAVQCVMQVRCLRIRRLGMLHAYSHPVVVRSYLYQSRCLCNTASADLMLMCCCGWLVGGRL
jgi:hypothetical protein